MTGDKSTTQALFHFLMSQLIVQCSQNLHRGGQQVSLEQHLRSIGSELGFKLHNHICLKRGVTQRPQNIVELLRTIQTKTIRHLFGYQLSKDYNTYSNQQNKTVVYGLIDEIALYLTWMPQACHISCSSVVAGIIEGVCKASDLKCAVTAVRYEPGQQEKRNRRDDRVPIQFLIQVDKEEHAKWDVKK